MRFGIFQRKFWISKKEEENTFLKSSFENMSLSGLLVPLILSLCSSSFFDAPFLFLFKKHSVFRLVWSSRFSLLTFYFHYNFNMILMKIIVYQFVYKYLLKKNNFLILIIYEQDRILFDIFIF